MPEKMPLRNWLSLAGLTLATFVFNTSEFVPIALLLDIKRDFGLTEATVGMLISVYAWVVMLLSLPLMLLVSKMELRRLMLWMIALFAVFQCLSFLSGSYAMLMLSRIGVACTHAIFWSIVSPIAVRIVPASRRALALSMIVTGTSVAMIAGLPLGRVIGLHIGWRMTFLSIGIVAFLTWVYVFFSLPKVPSRGGFSVRRLPGLLRSPALRGLYFFTILFSTAYYVCYSYIEPFLEQVAGMGQESITAVLMLFGAAGIAGSVAFSKYYGASPKRFVTFVLAGFTLCLALLAPLASGLSLVFLLCAAWGATATAYNVAMQSEVIHVTPPEGTSVAMSIFSGIFNLGIGCGAFFGGLICTHASVAYVGYAGAVLGLAALMFWVKYLGNVLARSGVR